MTPDQEVMYIYWRNVLSGEGRRVRFDDYNRLVAMVFWKEPVLDLSHAFISVPRTGAVYLHRKDADRMDMPAWAVQARFLEQLKFFGGPFLSSCLPTELQGCILCRAKDDDASKNERDLWVCYGCMSAWHLDCAHAFGIADYVRKLEEDTTFHDEMLSGGFLCAFCKRR